MSKVLLVILSARFRATRCRLSSAWFLVLLLSTSSAFGQSAADILISARRSANVAYLAELPAERLRGLEEAQRSLERLLSEFPESKSSQRLLNGEAVAGLRYKSLLESIATLRMKLGPCIPDPTSACLFDLAIETARKIEDPDSRAPSLASVASAVARSGDEKRARHLLNDAISVASDSDRRAVIDEVRSLAAWVEADLGNFEEALALVDQTQSALARALALNDIAKAHLARHDRAAAETVLARAEENLSETSGNERPAVQALLAEGYARANVLKQAVIHGYQAAETANEIVQRDARDTATVFAIRALAYAGETDWAWYLADNQVSDASYRCVAIAFLAEVSAEIVGASEKKIVEIIDGAQDTCPEPEESDSITDYAAVSIARGLALSNEFDLALEVLRLLPDNTVARAWGYSEVALILGN